MTEHSFKYIRRVRDMFIELIDGLSLEQINKVPEGFNNNIAWNFGHIVVSTLALCYVRNEVNTAIEIPYIEKYKIGTKPDSDASAEEILMLKELMKSSIDQIETDVQAGIFKNMKPYATSTFKQEMHSIEEVLVCTLAHDTIHLGYATAQRRLILNQK